METKFLRLPDVLRRYGIGRTTIYDLVAKSQFPIPIHVGRSSLWSSDELARFDEAKAAERGAVVRDLSPSRSSSQASPPPDIAEIG